MTIRIVIADDHPIVLAGLSKLFEAEPDLEVVAIAKDGNEALRFVRERRPDVLVLDMRMPGKNGLAVLSEMARDAIATRVVLLTAVESDELEAAIRLGVRGVLLKEMATAQIVEAVRVVHDGRSYIGESIARRASGQSAPRAPGTHPALTPREVQVAQMVADGLPSKHVAGRLAITEGTMKLHLHHIYSKLNVRGRVALIRYMQQNKLE
ncbi:MAG TPA: response regulator transcription factor [Casimicrobiaceae bacterium]|nr:response regulator transcription factor [Casimicrobiaceae bacterium]